MTMEKTSQSNEILHQNLRNEEANLMQEQQKLMTNPTTKTANERHRNQAQIEDRLNDVRSKLTELDLGGG